MKGRLKIVNESSYPTAEVERLVRFGLDELEITGKKVLVLIEDNRNREYRGWAGETHYFEGHPLTLGKQYKATYIIRVLLGKASQFPIHPWVRDGISIDYQTWQEALVGVAAHEAMHVQHFYDGGYEEKSGRRRVKITNTHYKIIKVRVGTERVESKCRAFEAYMLRRFRTEYSTVLTVCDDCGSSETVAEMRLDYADAAQDSMVSLLCDNCATRVTDFATGRLRLAATSASHQPR